LKIYTKTGDKGQTSLLTGKRVAKSHPRLEAYGTIDELNSFVGLLASYKISENDLAFLENIQHNLFNIGALLAMDEKRPQFKIKDIEENDILEIEKEMDIISNLLPRLTSFILPGGSQSIATAHVCRAICRRAERICVHLSENEDIDSNLIIYINRLSDYFFLLSRKIAHENKIEIPCWPKK